MPVLYCNFFNFPRVFGDNSQHLNLLPAIGARALLCGDPPDNAGLAKHVTAAIQLGPFFFSGETISVQIVHTRCRSCSPSCSTIYWLERKLRLICAIDFLDDWLSSSEGALSWAWSSYFFWRDECTRRTTGTRGKETSLWWPSCFLGAPWLLEFCSCSSTSPRRRWLCLVWITLGHW